MKVSAADKGTGKSESITIINEKGRLTQEEIDRMVAEAEEFAAEDETQKKRIEALNSLSSYVYGLKTQLGDSDGLGGKLDSDDKMTLLDAIKETTEWLDSEGQSAPADDLEEKLQETQNIANPIMSKLYRGSSTSPDSDSDDEHIHDEL